MQVILISYTNSQEFTIATAARVSYSNAHANDILPKLAFHQVSEFLVRIITEISRRVADCFH